MSLPQIPSTGRALWPAPNDIAQRIRCCTFALHDSWQSSAKTQLAPQRNPEHVLLKYSPTVDAIIDR
jgi:hypothetical protein